MQETVPFHLGIYYIREYVLPQRHERTTPHDALGAYPVQFGAPEELPGAVSAFPEKFDSGVSLGL
jgi:hypothetical protein